MKYKTYIIIGIPVILVLLVIVCWFFFSRSGDGGIIHPSSSGRSTSVGANAHGGGSTASGTVSEFDYTEAPDHIGERAVIRGTVIRTFTAKSGVTFFDFCQGFDACPFSAVIFASDLDKFGDLAKYERAVKLTGVIKSYQGSAEMVLNGPDQIE